jgi:hypothetical protein
MTVIFTTFPDMGHVGYLLPLARKFVQDGHMVEFWSGKQIVKWLPEGVEFRDICKKENGTAVFCMACAHAPTIKESLEVFKSKALERSLALPNGYDLSWATIDKGDEIAFKKRLLEPDVAVVVDDIAHILNWVGAFCNKHGVPNVRFCPGIFFTVLAKQSLLPLWGEGMAAFADCVKDGCSDVVADSPELEEPAWVSVRDSAPQHRFYTITPDFLETHGFAINEDLMFENHDGDQCQILGPVYDPEAAFSREAFKERGLEAWCNKAPFVFISLGSMVSQCVQSQASLQADLKKLLDALVNQRVLVNFSLPGYPERDNLNMAGWVPQKAILAHMNLQCFISHCGQGGVFEALCAGVPLVAYPFFHDQLMLAESIEKLGCGVWLQRFDHGPGIPVADADSAIERAVASKLKAQELGRKARGMNGFDTAYEKLQEFIKWSHENPCK